MKITEVRVFPRDSHDTKLRAFVTVTFDDCFVVRDLKVIEGSKGLFVAMPSRRIVKKPGSPAEMSGKVEGHETGDGHKAKTSDHRDIAHPITQEFRDYIQKTVLEAYQNQISKS